MDYKNIMIRIKQSVDVNAKKLQDLKTQFSQNGDSKIKEDLQSNIDNLERLSQDIQKQYDSLKDSEKMSIREMSEIEKTIYLSIESFGGAYTKVGSLIKKQ